MRTGLESKPKPFLLFTEQHLIGHCQLNYFTWNQYGEKVVYCLQDQGDKFGGIRLLRCSRDGEPSHEVTLKNKIEFQLPRDNEYDSDYTLKLKALCREWINKNALPTY